MAQDMRLIAKIYRAIQEFSNAKVDAYKCERIAHLIGRSDFPLEIEALVEQHADRIHTMRAEEFVGFLYDKVKQRKEHPTEEDIEMRLEEVH